ncbi:hypothetical protein SAMN05443575_1498 [Jatrophihabitans endophyticus]|uniref:PIN domain-containing protein n=1 Tax=Jatrophihabitans endophyticus TaxID=1206085 RepID=A0A1M5HEL9_9ACTN|nr:hypothetical protein SAMN05443575_1498 [Jatrophihabitans endophyticus]
MRAHDSRSRSERPYDLVPDAHLVALMRRHDVTVMWSHDRDLRRFAGSRV